MTFLDRYNSFKRLAEYMEARNSPIFESIAKLENKFSTKLERFIDSLSYSNGILDPTQDYTEQLLRLRKEVINEYALSEVRNELIKYIDSIPQILYTHASSISEINGLVTGDIYSEALAEDYAQKLSANFSIDVFAKDALQPILDNYRRMLSGQTRLTTFRNELEAMGGRMAQYSKQIVLDSQRTLFGEANNTIKNAYGLDGFIYEGGLVKESRPLCIHLVDLKRVVGIEELKLWLNEKKYPEFQEGLMPGTTASNFIQRVAGYGCRHKAQPVRLLESDIKAINKYWGKELIKV